MLLCHFTNLEVEPVFPEVAQTMEGLRQALFDEINEFRTGSGDPVRARSLCSIASKIIDSVRVQIQYQRVALQSGIPLAPKSLQSDIIANE